MNLEISVVIPCYKSGTQLRALVQQIEQELSIYKNFEIILVCDDSPDKTWEVIREITESSKNVRSFLLGRNVGQHASTKFGIAQSRGRLIITMDDDGQHQPFYIPTLISSMSIDTDLVYATAITDEHNFTRNFLSKMFKSLIAISGILPQASKMSSYRIFKREIIPTLETLYLYDGPVDSLLNMLTSKIKFIDVEMLKRIQGKSNYRFSSLVNFAINLSTYSTIRPMNFILFVGIIGSVLSFLLFIVIVLLYFMDYISVPGYASIVSTLALGFFLNFWILGSIGRLAFSLLASQQRVSSIWVRESSE